MCELHFRPEEIRREISHFDEKSGSKLVAKMTYPRLCEGVIPSQLPNCPSHLSGPLHLREAPDEKRRRVEESAIQAAIAKSIGDDEQYKKDREFHCIDELKEKLQCIDIKFWTVIVSQEDVHICHVIHSPQPKVCLSLVIQKLQNSLKDHRH